MLPSSPSIPPTGEKVMAEEPTRHNRSARRPLHKAMCSVTLLGLVAAGCGSGTTAKKDSNKPVAGAPLVPKAGGNLIVGNEAEESGFDPSSSSWDASGFAIANAVMDPLMAMGADGAIKPYLAESLTSNPDFTLWTMKLRPNVKFSDGEAFDAAAEKVNLEALRKSVLAGTALSDITAVTMVDNLTLTIKMKTSWSTFPATLTLQSGYPIAPKSFSDPDRALHPIGTGPFIMKEWIVGSHFTATKNPNYWRPGLPYLDSVEFRPIVEPNSRAHSLSAGTVDLIQTQDPQNIVTFSHDPSVNLLQEKSGRVDVSEVMLNTSKPPLDDVRVRQAIAYATDRNRFDTVVGLGVWKGVTGPFSSDSGYTNAAGYPEYDLAKARDLITQYEKDKGVFDVSFELGTVNTASSLASSQLLADMWSHAGIRANLVQVEQSSYINNALLGNYDAYLWRQFGEADPDVDGLWWDSKYAAPKGSIALNFSRNKDPKIDQDLADARVSGDAAQRKSLYQDISGQLNKDLPYIWTNQVTWAFASKQNVIGLDGYTTPEGTPLQPFLAGAYSLTQVWRNVAGGTVAPKPLAPSNPAAIRDTTAIDVSKADFPAAGSAKAVVLTRDDLFLDAGGPLATKVGGPLLFTPPANLDGGTQAEIARAIPKGGTVYLIGGNDALSPEVETTLSGLGYHVVRVSGNNRTETAAAVARLLAGK